MADGSSILQEIKQTRPFDSIGQEGVVALILTASVVRRRIDALIQPHGITGQQFNVLRILRGAKGPLPTMEVAERMIEPEPGITRMFERLERKELVRRERCVHDGRRMLCSITEKGLAVLAQLDKAVLDLDNGILENLTEQQTAQLIELLALVRRPLPSKEGKEE